jgi:hypothetical protein
MSICNGVPCEWSPAGKGAVSAAVIEGTPVACAADINGNNSVDVNDLLAVISTWGACAQCANCHADIAPAGGDCTVNVNDLLAVISAWGPCH